MPKYAFFRGRIVPFEEAKVSIANQTFNYGTGEFEGIRGFWNKEQKKLFVFALWQHYERLVRNWSFLFFFDLPYTVDDLVQVTSKLLQQEGLEQDLYIRPITFKDEEKVGVRLHNLKSGLGIFVVPFGSYYPRRGEEDVRAMVSSWRRIDDNTIPPRGKITGSYVNSALVKTEAELAGFDEGIVLTQDGHVAEASAANLFIIRGSKFITPPVSENILEGFTRQMAIALARDQLNLTIEERPIDRTELYIADEVGLCGTACNIAAVTFIDQRPVGKGKMGPVVEALREAYFKIVRGEIELEERIRWDSWLTEVEYTTPLERELAKIK